MPDELAEPDPLEDPGPAPDPGPWAGTVTTLEEAERIAADPARNPFGLSPATILDGDDWPGPGAVHVDPAADERIRTAGLVNPHTGRPRSEDFAR